jgi:FkbM family methyltransferase
VIGPRDRTSEAAQRSPRFSGFGFGKMKDFVLRLIRVLGSLVPVRVRHLFIKGLLQDANLIRSYGFVYLSSLSERLNIVRLSARGDYGIFSSVPTDLTIFRRYAETGKWSNETNKFIKGFFKAEAGTYLDIGANIGMTVVPLAVSDPQVKCHAFEPEPNNYQNLERNIAENCPAGNVKTYQLAIFDRETVLPFEIATINLGDHRLHASTDLPAKEGEAERKIINVKCIRLDDLPMELDGPLLVKVDTQGAEPFVFAGGQATLAKADILLLEWSPYLMARLGGDPKIIVDFLRKNFSMGRIGPPDDAPAAISDRKSMDEICSTLLPSITAWRDDPHKYVDVIAEKRTT